MKRQLCEQAEQDKHFHKDKKVGWHLLFNTLKLSEHQMPDKGCHHGKVASEQSSSNQNCYRFLQQGSHLSTNFSSPCQTTKGYKPSDAHLAVGQVATSESYSLFRFYSKTHHDV